MSVVRACENCEFCDHESRCRRTSPNVPGANVIADWPKVHTNDWCGEFRPGNRRMTCRIDDKNWCNTHWAYHGPYEEQTENGEVIRGEVAP